MSIVLHTTASATENHEKLIETAQKNIVNSNNPDYLRQDAKLVSDSRTGAEIESIDLIVNKILLEAQYQKTSEHSNLSLENHYLEKIIDLFGTPKLYHDGSKGVNLSPNLAGTLQTFFNSLKDLQPSSIDSSHMQNTVRATKNIAENVSKLAENLQKLRQEVDQRIGESVNELNKHLKVLKSLSDKLPLLKGNDAQYNDAKTKIINEIRDVSKIIDIKRHYDEHGSLVLETGDNTILIGNSIEYKVQFKHTDNLKSYLDKDFKFPALSVVNANSLEDAPQYRTDIVTSGTSEEITHYLKGGQLGALFNLRDKLIPDIVKNLDQFASNLVIQANDAYANAVPETGFQSIVSTEELGDDEGIYVNGGKFKIAFLNPNTGEALQHNNTPLSMLEFDLGSLRDANNQINLRQLIKEINRGPQIMPLTAELIDDDGNPVQSGQAGYLRLKADNKNFNFAIVDDGTNFNINENDFNNSNANGKLKGVNQFFGFNQLFIYKVGQSYDAESGTNSAISLEVSKNIITENKLATAKVTVESGNSYSVNKNNKDILKDLLHLKDKKLEFVRTIEMLKSEGTLSDFSNDLLLTLNSKNSATIQRLEVNKIELDGINERIASESGVNTDEELLNITQYERTYLSTLKVFQTFNEYWRQFLNQV